jgi:hypothetical protein
LALAITRGPDRLRSTVERLAANQTVSGRQQKEWQKRCGDSSYRTKQQIRHTVRQTTQGKRDDKLTATTAGVSANWRQKKQRDE